ncbi:hypothetical protein BV20DRAFT_778095 [Pilatotrama ljubarskyi]|nr:hypothetical protein BV20DRAFT_778095 [Pilatotrama ljubarskyi]
MFSLGVARASLAASDPSPLSAPDPPVPGLLRPATAPPCLPHPSAPHRPPTAPKEVEA